MLLGLTQLTGPNVIKLVDVAGAGRSGRGAVRPKLLHHARPARRHVRAPHPAQPHLHRLHVQHTDFNFLHTSDGVYAVRGEPSCAAFACKNSTEKPLTLTVSPSHPITYSPPHPPASSPPLPYRRAPGYLVYKEYQYIRYTNT